MRFRGKAERPFCDKAAPDPLLFYATIVAQKEKVGNLLSRMKILFPEIGKIEPKKVLYPE